MLHHFPMAHDTPLPADVVIEAYGVEALEELSKISIAFEVRSRVRLDALRQGLIEEEPVAPWLKDYDASPEDHPLAHAPRFASGRWTVLLARREGRAVGGAIVAHDPPHFHFVEHPETAVIVDLRVAPECRGHGIGAALFTRACQWAAEAGCHEIQAETQDTNAPACRFYRRQGCRIALIDERGYEPASSEAKLIWGRDAS
jgi:ribosomal protein S18 acetylase RimI-like enzyme